MKEGNFTHMAKQIVFNEEARRALKRGVDIVSEAVKTTLGPRGRNVALDKQFGVGASMMDPKFWTLITKGWEEADLHSQRAKTWFDAMVEKQVNMGTTLDLLWIA